MGAESLVVAGGVWGLRGAGLALRALGRPGALVEHPGQDGGHVLVEDLRHDQRQQPLLLLHEQWPVGLVPRQVQQRGGGAPQHVQAGAHRLGVVAQRLDAVLVGHRQRRLLRLLDETKQQGHCRRLRCHYPCR